MNYHLLFLLAASGISAIIFALFTSGRRPSRFLIQLLLLTFGVSFSAYAQNWSPFLDSSRATNWASAGFTIPNYTANCSVQPVLVPNSSVAALTNATTIQLALASCDASHNVVNMPAGTYYVAAFTFGTQGHQVLRGAGPNSTYLYITSSTGCGLDAGVCMISNYVTYGNGSDVLPGGSRQCTWSAGYAKGTTSITVNNCPGGPPPSNQTLILDQANDTVDNNGIYICDDLTTGCSKEAGPGDNEGRIIGGVTHSQQQVVYVTGTTSVGGGSYTVNFTPGLYYNNIRSSQSPGVWWPGFVQNDGIENLTLDYSQSTGGASNFGAITMYNCYQCWVKGVRSIDQPRTHVLFYQSAQDVVRDSYFYQAQGHSTISYGMEVSESSGLLIENNIIQQTTAPVVMQSGSGSVVDYNLAIGSIYAPGSGYMQAMYYNHNAGSNFNLWEGNNSNGIWADNIHGASTNGTLFRNFLQGLQNGLTGTTYAVGFHTYNRAFNAIGNVLGQPGYHNTYEAYATSTTGGVNGSNANTSIFELGWSDQGGVGVCATPPVCDPLARSTLMRWGNWDVVNGATQWNSSEASPASVPYVSSNFSSSYFGSLAHTLPASLYYSSKPSWWPTGKAWPPIGPDVSSGNVGLCTGTYAGAQATASGQCGGGTLTAAWASHANSIPAQDCYLSVMNGPPDGSGSVRSFDASKCYSSSGTAGGTAPGSPVGLTAAVD